MPHRSPIAEHDGKLAFHSDCLNLRLRLTAALIALPLLLVPFLIDDNGFFSVTGGVVGGLLLVLFAGPWRTGTGSTLSRSADGSWTTEEDTRADPLAPDDCDVFVLWDPQPEPSPPTSPGHKAPQPTRPRRLGLVRLHGDAARSMRAAMARRDAALARPRGPAPATATHDDATIASLVDGGERVHDFDDVTPAVYHAALGYELGRRGVAAVVIDEREMTPAGVPKPVGGVRLLTPAMAGAALFDRLGRTDDWPADPGAPPDALRARPGDPGLVVGALCVAGWSSVLWWLTDIERLLPGGLVVLGAGLVGWMLRPGVVLDRRGLRHGLSPVGRRLALEAIVDILAVNDEVAVLATDAARNLAIRASDREAAAELAGAMRAVVTRHAWARAAAQAADAGVADVIGDARDLGAVLPVPVAPGEVEDGALVDAAGVRLELRAGRLCLFTVDGAPSEIELARPLRALLSRSQDLAGVPLLHLEVRQAPLRGHGDWTRLQLSTRIERPIIGLDAVPVQGVRGTFVSLDAMIEVLAIVRGAMLAHDGAERWT